MLYYNINKRKYEHFTSFLFSAISYKICSDHLHSPKTHGGVNMNIVSFIFIFSIFLINGSKMLISSAVYCTSRHDLSHILHCKDREFLLCIHTDHTVAQPTHRQHRLPWRRNTHFWRSAGQTLLQLYSLLLNTMTHMERPAVKDIHSCQKPTLSLIPLFFLCISWQTKPTNVQLAVCTADRTAIIGQKKAFLILKIEPVCLFEACVVSLSVILILLHD